MIPKHEKKTYEKPVEKIKVTNLDIICRYIEGKPYYSIVYFDPRDKELHEGYSSYNLDIVFRSIENCFEIEEATFHQAPLYTDLLKARDTSERVYFEYDGYDHYGNPIYDEARCPQCNKYFEDGDDDWGANFCPNCGKRLNWTMPPVEEEEDE